MERQDEDLFSRSPSPLPAISSESDNEQDLNDGHNSDEVELSDFSTEEEPRTSVHLTAIQQLNTGFEIQAARAGMWDCHLRLNEVLLMENQLKSN